MHHFQYRSNEMYCEDVPIKLIAERVGTPFYLYSHATLKRHFLTFNDAFDGIDRLVCFSAKANTSLAVLKLFADLGGGLDIVSGGELYRGLKAGIPPEKIVYSGVGKREDEIDYALNAGILMFNIESLEELELINHRARLLKKKAPVAIRVNPDVDPKTHPYISTGLEKNKFGINAEAAIEGYKIAERLNNIDVIGIDCHIGSQITEAAPFKDALNRIKILINELRRLNIDIKYIDMGGGLGITYDDESPPHPGEYARSIMQAIEGESIKLILEPGRVIVGNAGILVAKVLYRKPGKAKEFVIVDAGMNDLVRPTLYNAFHAIKPVVEIEGEQIVADVVGPICETGDFLAVDRKIADLRRGDLLAVMSAGAYGFVMSSNYCSRLKVAEVMVRDDRFHVIRARQNYEHLIEGESIPEFLEKQS
ncbi:MAG: diaminopimelate decarboxylase [Proteobacteria bacterium]|nr:diaminopimelate decarboxylase [Desulfobacteraceae bacterium]MBU3979824.1 diaminopimelate decarboxylase [Pseudomonadota bacterium]MBU4012267.1 diaminopimelate decarboxylase [Pseudomonadota bacterium]MBU4067722.1 diaminopimelate decarboxylase [Pseudomonadota bacterium]MBU4100502.1 diaminopimelate decarboxylase [Pseudomonadota bacterium]